MQSIKKGLLGDKDEKAVSIHNLEISKEVLKAPEASKQKGACNHLPKDCTYEVTKIAYDIVFWANKYSMHFEFRISPDLPYLIFDPKKDSESHIGIPMLGIASVCKKYWQSYEGNGVYTSDCIGLKDFEFGPEGN